MTWMYVVLSVLLGVTGQLLMKKGMLIVGELSLSSFSSIYEAMLNPHVLLGFSCYGISSVLWLVAISKLPLSQAYPALSAGYILVVVASYFFFNEPMTMYKLIGISLICVGVLMIGKT